MTLQKEMEFKTAQEYVEWIDSQSGQEWSNDTHLIADAMEDYAKMYHERLVKESESLPCVSESHDFKIGYKNENGNMKEVLINAETCDDAYDKFKKQFGDIRVEYLD